jgi:hypothetical protein
VEGVTWRPYDPQQPEFKYRLSNKGADFFRTISGASERYEVYANGNFIGWLYSHRGYVYSLSENVSTNSYNLEQATDKLWHAYCHNHTYRERLEHEHLPPRPRKT